VTVRFAVALCRTGEVDERVVVEVVAVVSVVVLVSVTGVALSGVGVGVAVVSLGVGCASWARALVEESARAAAIAGRALARAQGILVVVIMPKQRSATRHGGRIIGSTRRPLDRTHRQFS